MTHIENNQKKPFLSGKMTSPSSYDLVRNFEVELRIEYIFKQLSDWKFSQGKKKSNLEDLEISNIDCALFYLIF